MSSRRWDFDDEEEAYDDFEDDLDSFDEDDPDDDGTVPCPYCREPIWEDSVRCPHCDRYISDADAPTEPKPKWFLVAFALAMVVALGWVFSYFVG